MPLLIALLVSCGTFFGYVAVDSGAAVKAVHYLNSPVSHDPHKPYFAIQTSSNETKGDPKNENA